MPSKNFIGLGLALLGTVGTSPDALLIKQTEMDVWCLGFYRFLLTSVGTLLYALVKHGFSKTLKLVWRSIGTRLSLFGILTLAVADITFLVGLRMLPAATALMIYCTNTVIVAIVSHFLLKDKLSFTQMFLIAVGLLGIGLVLFDNFHDQSDREAWIGTFVMLGCMCAWAAFYLTLRVIGNQEMTRERAVVDGRIDTTGTRTAKVAGELSIQEAKVEPEIEDDGAALGIVASLLMAGFCAIFARWEAPWEREQNLYLILIQGLIVCPLPNVLNAEAARYTSAAKISLVNLLEVVLGPSWVYLACGPDDSWSDEDDPQGWTGTFLLVGALFLLGVYDIVHFDEESLTFLPSDSEAGSATEDKIAVSPYYKLNEAGSSSEKTESV